MEIKEGELVKMYELVMADGEVREKLFRMDEIQLYHNWKNPPSRHTERFVDAVEELSHWYNHYSQENHFSDEDIDILKVSALLHDIVYPDGPEGHEHRSALFAQRMLTRLGVDGKFVKVVMANIEATHGQFANGTYVTDPQNLVEQIMCDADLCSIAAPFKEYMDVNEKLREESKENNQRQWLEGQIVFLSHTHWKTEAALQLWEEAKKVNIFRLQIYLENRAA